ncbi:hypothetical protein [Paenarthrobacter sp. YJN-5]|uniref:hypothetical protein n=1 Tax=Paenarthrobacter sp. YJN-5 TaxID=2735316 RepID=UPI00187758E1|nr:hypothetical protein [Paenarthrobacter sp. YJN-5]QOT15898.1 hypothetical protein HMI59_04370 [Paenarthrobacter sp. YJN-5]
MTQERIEAAARAMSPRVWGPQVWTFAAHGESPTAARARVQRESLEQAQTGLAAADAVMFSEAVLEQAETAVSTMRASGYVLSRDLVAAVVAALKGDA